MTTCTESSNNFAYMMLNLVGEVGEFASKVAKSIRKGLRSIGRNGYKTGQNQLHGNYPSISASDADREELKKEAGDILWQLAGLCKVMGWTLEEVAEQNLEKLASRQERGKIVGDGDNR